MKTHSDTRAFSTGVDTIPKMLRKNALKYGDRPAMRKKRYGIWNTHTWQDYYDNVKYIFLWMMSEGFQRGDKIGIIGDNDPEWWYLAVAGQAAGGVEFGMYIDCVPSEIEYLSTAADAVLIGAKDQEQIDKLLSVKDKMPRVKRVVYWEPKGLWRYDDPWLVSFEQAIEVGRQYEKPHSNLFEASIKQGQGDDVACICFTSGTTGSPKGAMLSYRALSSQANGISKYFPLQMADNYFSFLCPAWAADQIFGIGFAVEKAWVVCFPEKPDTAETDGREIDAKFQIAGTRLLEARYRRLQEKLADADPLKRFFYHICITVGEKVQDTSSHNSEEPHWLWKIAYSIANWLVIKPLRDEIGFRNAKCCLTSGAMISVDIFRYFQALGIPIYNSYGLTEAAQVCMERPGAQKLGSAGRVLPGREIRITDDGEILVGEDEQLFSGYYKNLDATRKVLYDGWYHTGDAGSIDEDGLLFFEDRISELMTLSSGVKFSPTKLEAMLRCSRYIADCVVLGNKRKFVSALLVIDLGNARKFAEKTHISYTTFVDLSQKHEVLELVRNEIRKVNMALPEGSRIRRFANLPKEFDPDEAELTRTAKLKRAILEDKYADMVDAIYAGERKLSLSTPVKYRDGRQGRVTATVCIEDVE